MTYSEIANLLVKKKNKHEWEPKKIEDYELPEFNIPAYEPKHQPALKRELSKVYSFIDYAKYLRFKDGCTLMPISCTSDKMIGIWGNAMGASRGINFMCKIGLLSVDDDSYQFNAYYDEDNKCKMYRYYAENEKRILGACDDLKINRVYDVVEVNNESEFLDPTDDEIISRFIFDSSEVRFSTNLNLTKPIDLSKERFELLLKKCLYKNYPELAYFQRMADEINKKYYANSPFQIKFKPHFTWTKKFETVTKISIRYTNALTNLKKEYRKVLNQDMGFNMEYDVNASVPRVSRSLEDGEWFSYTGDIYKLIFDNLDTDEKWSPSVREALKKLLLRTYFEDSYKQRGWHAVRTIQIVQDSKMSKEDSDEIYKKLGALYNAIEKTIGHVYGSEIFYYEACLYLPVLKYLLDNGIFTWTVYDCWYSKVKNMSKKQFTDMVENKLKESIQIYYDAAWPIEIEEY